VAIAVLLAACGGSSAKPPPATSNAPPPTTASGSFSGTFPITTPNTTGRTSTAGATGVRLPAVFTIAPGGKLTPASVSAPAGVLIGLTVISGDGRAHRVTVGVMALAVPAGGRAYAALQGLHTGRYPVLVDGVRRGTLIVGGQVGP
jgi:hypothetical protein